MKIRVSAGGGGEGGCRSFVFGPRALQTYALTFALMVLVFVAFCINVIQNNCVCVATWVIQITVLLWFACVVGGDFCSDHNQKPITI